MRRRSFASNRKDDRRNAHLSSQRSGTFAAISQPWCSTPSHIGGFCMARPFLRFLAAAPKFPFSEKQNIECAINWHQCCQRIPHADANCDSGCDCAGVCRGLWRGFRHSGANIGSAAASSTASTRQQCGTFHSSAATRYGRSLKKDPHSSLGDVDAPDVNRRRRVREAG
jgi:hypothetical protein